MTELVKDIKLSFDVYKRLLDLKLSRGFTSFNDVIRHLLDVHEGKKSDNILCNDFTETKASLAGWAKILVKKGILIPSYEDPEIYRLNPDVVKCT